MLFDLVVLGSDAAGLAAARLADEMGQRVCLVEDPHNFRRSKKSPAQWGISPSIPHFSGLVRFAGLDSLEITTSRRIKTIEARRYILACGNRPKRPAHISFDGKRILDSDEVRILENGTPMVLIVGAGEHGLTCADRLTEWGARVSLVDQNPSLNAEILSPTARECWNRVRASQTPIQFGNTVLGVESRQPQVRVFYENGSIESYDAVIYAVGREGCTGKLNLPQADLLLDETDRIWCDEFGQTAIPHIYAVGSVVGFPRFPGPAIEEASRVIQHAFPTEVPSGYSDSVLLGNSLVAQ